MRLISSHRTASLAVFSGLLVGAMIQPSPSARAQDGGIAGVKGAVVEPRLADANVKNCKISAPGNDVVEVGSLIPLSYLYPVAMTPPLRPRRRRSS